MSVMAMEACKVGVMYYGIIIVPRDYPPELRAQPTLLSFLEDLYVWKIPTARHYVASSVSVRLEVIAA